jgi:hypothetical protein
MTTITLEVPDELAEQFKIDPSALPPLIREVVAAKSAKFSESQASASDAQPIYREIVDFLSSSPTAEQIAAFKISDEAQERLEELLDKNREEGLTPEERSELDTYGQLNHLIIRLKARALSGQALIQTSDQISGQPANGPTAHPQTTSSPGD